jgi:hypothetical protein
MEKLETKAIHIQFKIERTVCDDSDDFDFDYAIFDEWEEIYKPTNPFAEQDSGISHFDEFDDHIEWFDNCSSEHIWTLREEGNFESISNGRGKVNRIYYFYTEVPWTDKEANKKFLKVLKEFKAKNLEINSDGPDKRLR